MHKRFTRYAIVTLGMSLGLVHGQNVTVATIASSWPLTVPTSITGLSFNTVEEFSVSYPVGLDTSSYISGKQLNTDFQAALSNYPNPADPPEAILSTVLQAILTKYPQMTGGIMIGTIMGPPQVIGGITIPGTGTLSGTISVTIGTYNPTTGVLGILSRAKPRTNTPVPVTTVRPAASN